MSFFSGQRNLLALLVLIATVAWLGRIDSKLKPLSPELSYSELFATPLDQIDILMCASELKKWGIRHRLQMGNILEVESGRREIALECLGRAGLPVAPPEKYGDTFGESERLTRKGQDGLNAIYEGAALIKVRAEVRPFRGGPLRPCCAVHGIPSGPPKEQVCFDPRVKVRAISTRVDRLHVWILTDDGSEKENEMYRKYLRSATGFCERRDEIFHQNDPWPRADDILPTSRQSL